MSKELPLGYRPELDGIRAIAILGVLGLHLRLDSFLGGDQGVTLFFVLSGFLITTLLIEEFRKKNDIDVTAFYARRFIRLAPALLVALFANILFYGPQIGWGKILLFTLPALFYVANWFRAAKVYLPGQGYTWSLSVEEQFYMIWPWAIKAGLKGSIKTLVIICIGLIISAEIVRTIVISSTTEWFLPVYYATWARGDAVLYGALAALWWKSPSRKKLPIPSVWALIGLVIIFANFVFGHYHEAFDYTVGLVLIGIAGIMLILGVVESKKGIALWFLRLPPVVQIGRLSYGIYLWNTLTLEAWGRIHGGIIPNSVIGIIFWLVTTLAIAELSHRYIETPVQKWARPKLKAWREKKVNIKTAA